MIEMKERENPSPSSSSPVSSLLPVVVAVVAKEEEEEEGKAEVPVAFSCASSLSRSLSPSSMRSFALKPENTHYTSFLLREEREEGEDEEGEGGQGYEEDWSDSQSVLVTYSVYEKSASSSREIAYALNPLSPSLKLLRASFRRGGEGGESLFRSVSSLDA